MCRTLLVLLLVGMLSLTVVNAQNSTYPVITPENVDQLRQVGTLGRGLTVDVRYADNDTIETVSYGGLWRYAADNLNTPPQWVNIPQLDANAQYSPDGRWLLTLSGELWDVEQQTVVRTFDTFSERAEFSQDSSILAYYQRTILPESDVDCLQDNSCMQRVILWDTAAQMRRLEIVETDVMDVELVANDTLLAVMQHEQTTFYDVATGEQAFIIPASLRSFSPDGTKAIAIYPADEENGVLLLVWDLGLQTVALTLSFLSEERISSYQFSDDSTLLAISTIITDENFTDMQGTVAVWDMASANRAATLPHDEQSFGLVFSPDNRYLATYSYPHPAYFSTTVQSSITLFDLQTFRINASIPNGLREHANAIVFRPDSSQLAIAYENGRLQTIDTQSGEVIGDIAGYSGMIVNVEFTSNVINIASLENVTNRWDNQTFESVGILENCILMAYHEPNQTGVCKSHQDDAETISMRDLSTGEEFALLNNESNIPIVSAAIHPNGEQLATITILDDVQVWNVETGALQRILQVRQDNSQTLAVIGFGMSYLRDGKYLIAGSRGTIWDAETGDIIAQPEIVPATHTTLGISETGNFLAIPSGDGNIYVWNLSETLAGQQPTTANAQYIISQDTIFPAIGISQAEFVTVAFNPDGTLMAVANGSEVKVFDTGTFTLQNTIPHRGWFLKFIPDGRFLIVAFGVCYSCDTELFALVDYARVWAVEG